MEEQNQKQNQENQKKTTGEPAIFCRDCIQLIDSMRRDGATDTQIVNEINHACNVMLGIIPENQGQENQRENESGTENQHK